MNEIGLQVIAGWFLADFFTGIWHCLIDHTSPHNPVLGKMAREFQEHHADPQSMERTSFIGRNYQTVLASIPAFIFACFGWPVFWITLGIGAAVCQQAHHWSHSRRPRVVTWLQQLGILISPEQHMRHHHNFERHYGILNGWSHRTLDFIRNAT